MQNVMTPAYILDNITFAYDKGSFVLSIPRLEITQGEITALLGPNGSGKTTLLHLLAFLKIPQSGEIHLFGEKAARKNIVSLRRRTGLLAQSPYLFRSSVLANIEWGLKVRGVSAAERKKRSIDALAQVGLSGVKNRSARHLSSGEVQRIALARVLALNPDVFFLDEPATYMDQESAALAQKTVLNLNKDKGTTIIFTTHDIIKGYSMAHRVLGLFQGKPAPVSLANLFRGKVCGTCFDTGRLVVHLPAGAGDGTHISIDPTNIVLSKEHLDSSMRNTFRGRIAVISQEGGKIRVEVASNERFQTIITSESLTMLDLRLGDEVWLSFKSTAVKIF